MTEERERHSCVTHQYKAKLEAQSAMLSGSTTALYADKEGCGTSPVSSDHIRYGPATLCQPGLSDSAASRVAGGHSCALALAAVSVEMSPNESSSERASACQPRLALGLAGLGWVRQSTRGGVKPAAHPSAVDRAASALSLA